MAWTDLIDAVLAVGKPGRALHMRALRDNIIALAYGLSGAPKIQNDAFVDGSIYGQKIADYSIYGGTKLANLSIWGDDKLVVGSLGGSRLTDGSVWGADKLANASVTYPKFYVDSNFNAFIGQRIAALGINQIGTVAFLRANGTAYSFTPGNTYSASVLDYAGVRIDASSLAAEGSVTGSPSPAGTWMALGYSPGGTGKYAGTLFMRVA